MFEKFKKRNNRLTKKEIKETKDECEDSSIESFDRLNGYLEQNIEGVTISVCGDGNEYSYQMIDYKLSYLSRYLILYLRLDCSGDFKFRPQFFKIKNFDFSVGEDKVKVWIYTQDDSYRFYLKGIFSDFIPKQVNTKSYDRQEKEYEKYKNEDPLEYQRERFKDMYEDIRLESGYMGKTIGYYYLMLTRNKNSDNGTIHLITKCNSIDAVYFKVFSNRIEIIDIIHAPYNEGIGTNAVNLLIDYAKSTGVKELFGYLSPVDDTHYERREYFYKKLGFSFYGRIVKKEL